MESKELAKQAVISLDKHKAEDIRIISIRDLTVIADYFVIANGTSSTQVKALADYVETEMGERGVTPLRIEGYPSANWVLIDYGSVIVHIFYKETRAFYDLERLWKDGQQIELSTFLGARQ
ncbi:MAG: ribosome silencing factor [Clostridiales bacterium]|jgi:ribosome-associated protein|nr:ribosome silencing factor [Clostridiales bacterium]